MVDEEENKKPAGKGVQRAQKEWDATEERLKAGNQKLGEMWDGTKDQADQGGKGIKGIGEKIGDKAAGIGGRVWGGATKAYANHPFLVILGLAAALFNPVVHLLKGVFHNLFGKDPLKAELRREKAFDARDAYLAQKALMDKERMISRLAGVETSQIVGQYNKPSGKMAQNVRNAQLGQPGYKP